MFGLMISKKRKELCLTQQELCKIIGIPESTLYAIEKCETNYMTLELFNKFQSALGLKFEEYEQYIHEPNDYAKMIKEARLKNNMSKKELAKVTGLKTDYITKLEGHKFKNLQIKTFEKLAGPLQLDKNDFAASLLNDRTKLSFKNDGLFGQTVYEKRMNLKIAQIELANMANISDSIISRLESNDRTSLSTVTAMKLMCALNFSEEEVKKYLPNITDEIMDNYFNSSFSVVTTKEYITDKLNTITDIDTLKLIRSYIDEVTLEKGNTK